MFDSPGAVISNHCSYFDILILMSRYFPSFVARSNTQDMPLIGICRSPPLSSWMSRDLGVSLTIWLTTVGGRYAGGLPCLKHMSETALLQLHIALMFSHLHWTYLSPIEDGSPQD